MARTLITVEQAGRALGVSRSTVWRRIQRASWRRFAGAGDDWCRRRRGEHATHADRYNEVPPFSDDHPIFLVGARRGEGRTPEARDDADDARAVAIARQISVRETTLLHHQLHRNGSARASAAEAWAHDCQRVAADRRPERCSSRAGRGAPRERTAGRGAPLPSTATSNSTGASRCSGCLRNQQVGGSSPIVPGHSARSVSIGSTETARRAGR